MDFQDFNCYNIYFRQRRVPGTIKLCAFYFHKAVKDIKSMLAYLEEIYLILRSKDDEHIFVDMFSDAVKITERSLLKQSNFGNNKKFGKTLTSKPKEDEMCCICMDAPNNPKKLDKCGHDFGKASECSRHETFERKHSFIKNLKHFISSFSIKTPQD